MNKTSKLTHLFILTILLIGFGCSNDDDAGSPISLEDLAVSMDENPSNGQTVGMVETVGGTAMNFSIVSQSPAGAMDIDSSSGELTVANASLFDYETNATITATIDAENAENTATITVTLNNVNEVSAQALEVTMDENPTNGDVVGSLQATGTASGFTITSQTPAGALTIDSATGELTVADATLFDYETNPTLTATVTLEDAQNPVTVTVNLDNVFEVTVQDITLSVDENPTDGQVIGIVQTSGATATNFNIVSQTPNGALNIDAATGELSVVDPNLFDFETNPTITATVIVDDAENPATVTINLNDVDEITVQPGNFTIDENPSNGDSIGTLQATAGSSLTYTITFQNPVGAFSIDQNTGELFVADETLFDFEANPNMFATISVDNGTYSVSANVFVALNNLNEIGEFKYGGVIFWIDPADNGHGLVSAITDQSTSATWGCQGTLISGTGTGIGSGDTNTAAIIAGCATPGIAADIASNTTIDGYSDWFLPSRSELNQMYAQKAIIDATAIANGGTAFPPSVFYWSSTEANSNTAWAVFFDNGNNGGFNKGVSTFYQVRVVREFDLGN
ncbi:DUF1566 domain-containing protein [Flagellimonas amoyensis]|uniref:Lcl domain-containing protein n=1 Tax=Flagellimonas amoyensis TaxID=2169401 RepID=UPI000D340775|nr:DUF1566 domain-containing protein [Allomuricauda amoyensis]